MVCAACERDLPWLGSACVRCALPLASCGPCGECLRSPPPFDRALAAFEYRFPIDRVIHRYKSAGDLALGRWLAQCLARRVRGEPLPDALVAPAIGAKRLRERGFDQALEIAKEVGRALGVPVERRGVTRVRETTAQRALGARERRANLRGAFACSPRVAGRRLALVDDVITTGATAREVAAALRESGARSVAVWAVARTP